MHALLLVYLVSFEKRERRKKIPLILGSVQKKKPKSKKVLFKFSLIQPSANKAENSDIFFKNMGYLIFQKHPPREAGQPFGMDGTRL